MCDLLIQTTMQYLAMATSSRHQPAVLLSSLPPSAELHDKMYADLVASLVWSRDSAERRAADAESRLHALHAMIATHPGRGVMNTTPSSGTVEE